MRETIPFTITVKNIKDLDIPFKINVQNLLRKKFYCGSYKGA